MDRIRYIKVCGDFESTGLWDETTYLQVYPDEINLPEHFVKRLDQLVKDYDPILPLDGDELQAPPIQEKIREIDARGTELTKELATFLGDKFSLRYYSEGLQKFIEI